MSPDLSLVPTERLIAELKSRFDAVVVAYERRGKGADTRIYEWGGGLAAALGLVVLFQNYLMGVPSLDDTEAPGEEE